MRISKLLMPAVTVAGALALAGCGGGSSTTTTTTTERNTGGTLSGSGTNGAFTDADCVSINGAGSEANAAGTGCSLSTSQAAETAFTKAGGTPVELLLPAPATAGGVDRLLNVNATEATSLPTKGLIDGLHGSVNEGKTWDEALGATKVSKLSIRTGGNLVVGEGLALRVTGKELSDLGISSVADSTEGAVVTADTPTYMGIAGRLICNGIGCSSTSDANPKFTGDWYFQAWTNNAVPTGLYVKSGKVYVSRAAATAGIGYVDWGVWLLDDPDASANIPNKAIHWIADAQGGAYGAPNITASAGHSSQEATYKGSAVGISNVYKNGDDPATVGTFTAVAELTATFAAAAEDSTLEGKISDFMGHAGENWELTLSETDITDDSGTWVIDGGGTALGASPINGGEWNAEIYGKATERPAGIVGDFDGRFPDGQAIGVYHATPE